MPAIAFGKRRKELIGLQIRGIADVASCRQFVLQIPGLDHDRVTEKYIDPTGAGNHGSGDSDRSLLREPPAMHWIGNGAAAAGRRKRKLEDLIQVIPMTLQPQLSGEIPGRKPAHTRRTPSPR